MTIDQNISDLFFNRDLDGAKISTSTGFEGWSGPLLREEAETFLGNLRALNVPVPTVEELLADFHARV